MNHKDDLWIPCLKQLPPVFRKNPNSTESVTVVALINDKPYWGYFRVYSPTDYEFYGINKKLNFVNCLKPTHWMELSALINQSKDKDSKEVRYENN